MRIPILVLPLVLLGSACRHVPASDAPRGPAPASPPGYYDAPGPVPEALSITTLRTTPYLEVREIVLPARFPEELAGAPDVSEPIHVVHYRPSPPGGKPRPLVLMSPVLGGRGLMATEFATAFSRRGYHVALVDRKPFEFDAATALEHAETEFRLLVMRSRQALDWMALRPDVDSRRMGSFGISAGAIIGVMVAGADPRLEAHVFLLGGGPLSDVLVDSSEDEFSRYAATLEAERGLTREDVRTRLRRSLLTDPIRLAAGVDPRQTLLVLASHDRSVPYRNGLALWKALGRPELRVVPLGHRTAFLLLPELLSVSADFLGARLGTP